MCVCVCACGGTGTRLVTDKIRIPLDVLLVMYFLRTLQAAQTWKTAHSSAHSLFTSLHVAMAICSVCIADSAVIPAGSIQSYSDRPRPLPVADCLSVSGTASQHHPTVW